MRDHLGSGGRYRLGNRVGVESIGYDRTRPQAAHEVLLRCAPGHSDHLVASFHEQRDERSAENPGGAGYEDFHDCSFRLIISLLTRGRCPGGDSA